MIIADSFLIAGLNLYEFFPPNSDPILKQTPIPSFVIVFEFVSGHKRNFHYLLTDLFGSEHFQGFAEIAVLFFDCGVLVAAFVGAAMGARVVLPTFHRRGAPAARVRELSRFHPHLPSFRPLPDLLDFVERRVPREESLSDSESEALRADSWYLLASSLT